jgi:hypothetical protein
MAPFIHSLYVYPIKSCQGIRLQQAILDTRGIEYDRRWMLVDERGRFLSQRELPQMALIACCFADDRLVVSCGGHGELSIPLQQSTGRRVTVGIWNDQCNASEVSPESNRWFSDVLDRPVRLVYLPDDELRQVDLDYAQHGDGVGFADGFPLLILSLDSVRQLGVKLGERIDIARFRPNLVVDGCAAHAEDGWSSLSVDGIRIRIAKPCSRCAIPGLDPASAKRHPTLLRTLAGYRRRDGKVYFGQNALHLGAGIITTGQAIGIDPE